MDDIDKNIIMLLKENSRIPVSLIAQKVGRSRTVVSKRIDELVNSGEISKFTVQLKQKKLPVLFFVKLAEGFRCKDVISQFEKEYFFNSAISISGELDLIIDIDFDDAKDVSQAHEALSRLEEVAMVKTNLVVNVFT